MNFFGENSARKSRLALSMGLLHQQLQRLHRAVGGHPQEITARRQVRHIQPALTVTLYFYLHQHFTRKVQHFYLADI